MVVNFKTRGISQGTCKLTQTPTLIKKKKKQLTDQSEGVLPELAAVRELLLI